jgi:hypothetical protein
VDKVRDDSQRVFVFGGKTEPEFLECECNGIELAILKIAGEEVIIPYYHATNVQVTGAARRRRRSRTKDEWTATRPLLLVLYR